MSMPEGLLYVPDFLSSAELDNVLNQLKKLEYEHDIFRGQRLKRGYAQFGYSYVSTGRRLEESRTMPSFLQEVIDRAASLCAPAAEFNQCIVTHYPAGAGIGWHTDAPRFGEHVVGISLGAAARLQFRANGSEEVAHEVKATPGSLYRMMGAVRWKYQHQVVAVRSERYSLTFRQVIESSKDAKAEQR